MFILLFVAVWGCNRPKEHTAPAIRDCDSVAMMVSYGINTMISDSGVMKYRIIAERWEVNEVKNPPRWIFPRGVFLEQFDEKLHIEAYVQSDTAYYYSTMNLWHLIGNVRVRTVSGVRYNSEELFWDQTKHELYSNVYSKVVTPEREMEGSYFRSDERMTRYFVSNSKGSFEQSDMDRKEETTQSGDTPQSTDSVQKPKRQPTVPHQRKNL